MKKNEGIAEKMGDRGFFHMMEIMVVKSSVKYLVRETMTRKKINQECD